MASRLRHSPPSWTSYRGDSGAAGAVTWPARAEFLARRLLAETGDTGDDAIAQVEAGVARLVELGLFYRLFV